MEREKLFNADDKRYSNTIKGSQYTLSKTFLVCLEASLNLLSNMKDTLLLQSSDMFVLKCLFLFIKYVCIMS